MKVLIATWPLTSTMLLFVFLTIRFLVGELPIPATNVSIVDLLLITIGHFVAFFLVGSIILNKLKDRNLVTKELTVRALVMAALTAALQLFWRYINDRISSIDCAHNCANTLYAAPGLPMAMITTWIAVLGALVYFTVKILYYRNTSALKI